MSRFEVQRLAEDGYERLRVIRLEALREAPDAFGTTHEEAATWSLPVWKQQAKSLPTFIAARSDADVGMVRGCVDPEDATSAWLISMWVAPLARGQGVGRALVEAVTEWARGTGASRLLLDVADDNIAATALYARMGFVSTGCSGSLPPPREHVREHQRALQL